MGMVALTVVYPQNVEASEFTSAEFLTWERGNREGYIDASIGMAALVVMRNDKSQVKCIDEWYVTNSDKRNDEIFAKMAENQQYHPRAVLLAMMEKACGSFVYKK